MEVVLDLGGSIGVEFWWFVVGFLYVIFFILVLLEFVLINGVDDGFRRLDDGFRRVVEFEICYLCCLVFVDIL